ncbi:MAG TPA: HTTM domain-containing protein [Acidimicrobiia bacterium]|nr:HTTM domain-containing protein [Acidimicrobiia bacterium]
MANRLISRVVEKGDRETLASLFAIDTRALAAMRIGLAAILLYDSIGSLSNSGARASVTYSSIAVLPVAVALLVGFKTRWATVLSWLIYGIPIRQALIEPGVAIFLGKYVLALFLFWSIFLPLDARWSIDRSRMSHPPGKILSVASAAALIQVFFIYFFSGINKNFREWVLDPSAMKTVLGSTGFGNDLGRYVAQADVAMAVVSVLTIALEVVGALLLFVPGRYSPRIRVILVGAFIAFHIGMAIFMNLGIFPFVMISIWLLFLPSSIWDRVTNEVTGDEAPVTDQNLVRNAAAAAALLYITVSNYITWAFFPADSGWAGQWQQVGVYLLLYQQWAMFSIPSTLV